MSGTYVTCDKCPISSRCEIDKEVFHIEGCRMSVMIGGKHDTLECNDGVGFISDNTNTDMWYVPGDKDKDV